MTERAQTVLAIEGMTCGACVGRVERALAAVDGVEVVEVRLRERQARVRHASECSVDAMIEALEEAGYDGERVR